MKTAQHVKTPRAALQNAIAQLEEAHRYREPQLFLFAELRSLMYLLETLPLTQEMIDAYIERARLGVVHASLELAAIAGVDSNAS